MGSYPNTQRNRRFYRRTPEPAPYQQPVRKQRSSWASAPATYVLVGINCAVFLAMLANHVSFMSPSPDDLMHWGANNAGAVLILGQWWRVVTAMFVHVGIIHLATNMWCLWNLGMLAESLIGTAGVFAAYILTGAAGNLLSVFASRLMAHPADGNDVYFGSVGAGASGAVFGLAGLLIVLLKSPLLPVPPEELKRLRKSVIYFAGINLLIGLGYHGFPVHSCISIIWLTSADVFAGFCSPCRWSRASALRVSYSSPGAASPLEWSSWSSRFSHSSLASSGSSAPQSPRTSSPWQAAACGRSHSDSRSSAESA